MRIVHVAHVLHPDAGGPPIVAINLAAAQARLGHTVTVIGHYLPKDRAASLAMFENIPFEAPLSHRLLPLGGPVGGIIARPFRRVLKSHLKTTDILIAHGMWGSETVHAALLAKKSGVSYVIRPAGMLDPWSLQQKYWKKSLALRLFYGKILRHAAFIHATGAEEAANVEGVLARLRISVPVHVIPNGIFLKDIESPPPKGRFFSDHPELNNRPFVVFLGRLHHKKRPDLLTKAFASISRRFPELQLIIAGPDVGETATINRLAAELKIADRVHLLGPVYGAKKFEMLADAACFCLPSEQENFGIAVAEAMATGVPVVVSNQVQIWRQVEEAGAGVSCALTVESVAGALERVLGDEAARDKMGLAGQQLTKNAFLWADIGIRSTEQYAEVIASRPAPVPTHEVHC